MPQITPDMIAANISKNVFKPHIYLSNLCLAFFQEPGVFVSTRMFPTVPVPLASAKFYEFDRGDLSRDNVQRKPEFGHVAPAIFGKRDHTYYCEVDQILHGLDQISTLEWTRSGAPAIIDPRRAKVRFIAEQMKIHLDKVWAAKYFKAASWSNVYTGVSSTPSTKQFYQFDNANSDPVIFFSNLANKMLLSGLRRPNKICMGVNVFAALQNNGTILERIKYQGSEANPADVTVNVLAQLFKVQEIVVAESVINDAPYGAKDNIRFICDPNSLLMTYTTNAPSIEEPSAGYTFTWDMLGNGMYTAVQQYLGEASTHTEFIEGLLCTDPEITCKDLGVFLKDAVSSDFSA